jgi:hypothetical protein
MSIRKLYGNASYLRKITMESHTCTASSHIVKIKTRYRLLYYTKS